MKNPQKFDKIRFIGYNQLIGILWSFQKRNAETDMEISRAPYDNHRYFLVYPSFSQYNKY